MSSATTTEILTSDREQTDTKEVRASDPIQLCQFLSTAARTPLYCIERTAQYTKNPKEYLKAKLGEDVFNQRESQLCIPDEIDRDFYGVGKYRQRFEQHIARLLGKKNGLFFITGVQAQLAAMKIHCDQVGNNRVAWHVTSHLESAEERAYSALYGLERLLLGTDANKNPSVDDIKQVLSGPEVSRPAAILLEIPNRSLGCETYSFEELKIISEECRKAGVRLHCDGARLWEVEPYYLATAGKSFSDIGGIFDSVYVSFYKGLQGSSGAILANDDANAVELARKWQRRAGGNVFTMQYQVIDAQRGYNENIGSFAAKREKMMDVAARIKNATSGYCNEDGTPYIKFVPRQPTCCQTYTFFQGFSADELMAARDRVQEKTLIRVFERLRPKMSLDEEQEKRRAIQAAEERSQLSSTIDSTADDKIHAVEWMIVEGTQNFDTEIFADGYVALCEELRSGP